MKTKTKITLIVFLSILLLSILTFKLDTTIAPLQIVEGKAVIEKKLPQDKMYHLQGEWEFYWQQFVQPDEFNLNHQPTHYIQTPASWKDININTNITSKGYGTYRLHLQFPEEAIGTRNVFYFDYIGVAYNVWIDGDLVEQVGQVGSTANTETPYLKSNIIHFEPKEETVELVVQVSNHHFREGGIFGDVYVGKSATIVSYFVKQMTQNILLIGGFLFIGIYYLVMYGVSKKDVTFLFVGIIGFLAALRNLLLNEYIFHILFPTVPWSWMARTEYLCEIIGLFFRVKLIHKLYPAEVNKSFLKATYIIILLITIYYVIAPVYIYTNTLMVAMVIIGIILTYFIFVVGIKAFYYDREGAKLNVYGVGLLGFAGVHDILFYTQVVHTGEILGYSTLLFLMIQGINISDRYAKLMDKNQSLTRSLVRANMTLENKVEERTAKLREANEKLANINENRATMLAQIAHDLGSPIVAIETQLTLMKEGYVEPNERLYDQMIQKSGYMARLVQDLFELSKLESKEFKLVKERVSVKEFLNEVNEFFSEELKNKQFELQFVDEIKEPLFVELDKQRMMQVLSNFFQNAVKFSGEKKLVFLKAFVKTEGTQRLLQVEVKDFGIGVKEENIPFVFNRFYRESYDHEDGSGLGLTIAKEIMDKHGGAVGVRSKYREGSMFYFVLPISE